MTYIAWVADILRELDQVGFGLVLYVSPTTDLSDHHTLCETQDGTVQADLADGAADALIRALRVVDNRYQRKQP